MATYDGASTSTKKPVYGAERRFIVENVIDCSAFTDVSGVSKSISASDIITAITVPAGHVVQAIKTKCLTVESSTCTVDIGYTSSASTAKLWGDNLNMNSASVDNFAAPLHSSKVGLYFAAADTIDILFNNAAASAKIGLIVVMDDLRDLHPDA